LEAADTFVEWQVQAAHDLCKALVQRNPFLRLMVRDSEHGWLVSQVNKRLHREQIRHEEITHKEHGRVSVISKIGVLLGGSGSEFRKVGNRFRITERFSLILFLPFSPL
jgi:hypothetical protein